MWPCAPTTHENVHTIFFAFFATFHRHFLNFDPFPDWKWKKNEAALQICIKKT